MLKHAFILSVHTNFSQIKVLIKTLLFGDVFIHVDKKQQTLFEQLKEYYSTYENVYVIENRITVNWSGLSQVKATLNLLMRLNPQVKLMIMFILSVDKIYY